MKHIVVDKESYYDSELSVTTIGLQNYARLTDVYLVSMVSDDIKFCGHPTELGKEFNIAALNSNPNIQFWAANSNFDQTLWERLYGKTHRPWKCILDRAAYSQLPRNLAQVAKTVLKIKIDKSVRDEMKGKHYEELPPEEQRRVWDYCLNDSVQEWEVLQKLPPMTPVEEEIAEHTRMINRRGVHVNVNMVERDKTYLARIRGDAFQAIPWAANTETPLSYARFVDYCNMHGVAPPKSLDKRDEECDQWMQDNPKLAPVLKAMRTYRGANTKFEKLQTLLGNITDEGILPLELLYCGARHTRRWSSKGFNVQNLDKERTFVDEMAGWPEFQGNDAPEPGIFMREYLIPRPGKTFGILDYSQVEPRCLNWLAGNDELLGAIRQGFGIYEAYARACKGWKGDPGTLKKESIKKYTQYKSEVLGLGYGMGASRYFDECAKTDRFIAAALRKKNGRELTPEELAKVCLNLSMENAVGIVHKFREDNPKITSLWKRFDRLIQMATMEGDRTIAIKMPTGDYLKHFSVSRFLRMVKRTNKETGEEEMAKEVGFMSFTIKGDRSAQSIQERLWGGTLTENVTQRMARDILAEAVVKLEKAGFPVIFHAHDEVIIELDEATAERDLEEAKRMMQEPPAWCPDIPLGVDGDLSPHYTKFS